MTYDGICKLVVKAALENPRDKSIFRGLTRHKLRVCQNARGFPNQKRRETKERQEKDDSLRERKREESVGKGVLCYSGCSERVSEW